MAVPEITSPPRPLVAVAGWADHLELECLTRADNNVSTEDLAGWLRREDDQADTDIETGNQPAENDEDGDGAEPEARDGTSPTFAGRIAAVMDELQDRERHVGSGWHCYPFELAPDGRLLRCRAGVETARLQLYLFLLLTTRFNMLKRRKQGRCDGTKIFELLCAAVAQNYWGQGTSESLVFGTAGQAPGGWTARIAGLCGRTGEGGAPRQHKRPVGRPQDDKLDVVVWRSFADGRCGKLWGYGQCKTGSSWGDQELSELDPRAFHGNWMQIQPPVEPVRLFFASERCSDRDQRPWEHLTRRGGVFFDRCRIVEWAPEPTPAMTCWPDLQTWTSAAVQGAGLALP